MGSSNATPGHALKSSDRRVSDTRTPMFTAVLATKVKGRHHPSVHRPMNRQTTPVYTHDEILFSLEKEGNFDTGDSMDGP